MGSIVINGEGENVRAPCGQWRRETDSIRSAGG